MTSADLSEVYAFTPDNAAHGQSLNPSTASLLVIIAYLYIKGVFFAPVHVHVSMWMHVSMHMSAHIDSCACMQAFLVTRHLKESWTQALSAAVARVPLRCCVLL